MDGWNVRLYGLFPLFTRWTPPHAVSFQQRVERFARIPTLGWHLDGSHVERYFWHAHGQIPHLPSWDRLGILTLESLSSHFTGPKAVDFYTFFHWSMSRMLLCLLYRSGWYLTLSMGHITLGQTIELFQEKRSTFNSSRFWALDNNPCQFLISISQQFDVCKALILNSSSAKRGLGCVHTTVQDWRNSIK